MVIKKINFQFQFRTPKLIFGRDSIEKVPDICSQYGFKGFLITGTSFKKNTEKYRQLIDRFEELNVQISVKIRSGGEPTVSEVDCLAESAVKENIDWILGIGGGSSLDLAKATSGLATNEGSAGEYQKGKVLSKKALPFIAVPTTSGTGSEITNNSVLIDHKNNIKKSIRGDSMLAKVAVYDPILTMSMSPDITANTGCDALTQAIESYVSKSCNVLSDNFAEKSIELIVENLEVTYKNGQDINAREKMLYGSMLSGISFSNSKLGAVHGFAHPIGALHHVPHGKICGLLLPYVMKFNLKGNQPEIQRKFARIFKIFNPNLINSVKSDYQLSESCINEIILLLEKLHIPKKLSEVGIKKEDIPEIIQNTKGSSLANNPRDTNQKLLTKILVDAL